MACNDADKRPDYIVNGVREGEDIVDVDDELPDIFIRKEEERPRVAYNEFTFNKIPVISIRGYEQEPERSRIRDEIFRACQEWGLFQVVDHGIDEHLIQQMQTLSRQFFALPAHEKIKYDMRGDQSIRGGFVVGSPLPVKNHAMNYREFFTFISYPTENRDYSLWPDKPTGWKSVVETFCEKNMDLAIALHRLLSEALGLDPEALTDACVNVNQKLIANYYPRCSQPDKTLGLHPHTDPGTITLLLQDDHVGGLQVSDDDGATWITVPPIRNAFVVNVGDYLMMVSNWRLKSALHQVVVNAERSRVSIGVFHAPANNALVYPLEGVVKEGEKCRMDAPMTFTEMHRKKLSREFQGPRHAEEEQPQQRQEHAASSVTVPVPS